MENPDNNDNNKVVVEQFVVDEKGKIRSEGKREVTVEENIQGSKNYKDEIASMNTNSGVEGAGKPNIASSGDIDSTE